MSDEPKKRGRPAKTALVPQANVPIEAMIQNAIDKGVTVDVMERLLAMFSQIKAAKSKEAFDRAMAAFQAECPTIKKTKEVRNRGGELLYSYAPIESIVSQVAPLLERHGFSYAFDTKTNGVISAICTVTHSEGHSKDSSVSVPAGSGSIMSEAQKVASSITFAKRYAFCNAFGIMTGDEDDDNRVAVPREPMKPYKVERLVSDYKIERLVSDDGTRTVNIAGVRESDFQGNVGRDITDKFFGKENPVMGGTMEEARKVKEEMEEPRATPSVYTRRLDIANLLKSKFNYVVLGKSKEAVSDKIFDLTGLELQEKNYDDIFTALQELPAPVV